MVKSRVNVCFFLFCFCRYFAVCFLNQLILTKKDSELATRLISIYFSFFGVSYKNYCNTVCHLSIYVCMYVCLSNTISFVLCQQAFLKKGDMEAKMLSALLTGVNRAFPFAKGMTGNA